MSWRILLFAKNYQKNTLRFWQIGITKSVSLVGAVVEIQTLGFGVNGYL